jgi:hypothetical protein
MIFIIYILSNYFYMFATKVNEKEENGRSEEKATRRKGPQKVARLEEEVPLGRELDSEMAIKRLTDRVS